MLCHVMCPCCMLHTMSMCVHVCVMCLYTACMWVHMQAGMRAIKRNDDALFLVGRAVEGHHKKFMLSKDEVSNAIDALNPNAALAAYGGGGVAYAPAPAPAPACAPAPVHVTTPVEAGGGVRLEYQTDSDDADYD